jgi:hypothetical protein
MKRQLAGLILFIGAAAYAQAQSDVYLCVDASGKKEYKNTGATKGCKRVDLPGIMTIPAPAKKYAAPAAAAKTNASPPEFPKVDSGAQKLRDGDRKQILLDELKVEEQKMANLKKEYNNGEPERHGDERNYAKYQERVSGMKDDLNRAEKNVEALRREIANVK